MLRAVARQQLPGCLGQVCLGFEGYSTCWRVLLRYGFLYLSATGMCIEPRHFSFNLTRVGHLDSLRGDSLLRHGEVHKYLGLSSRAAY